ncbi:hypothetical protein [Mycobacteroides abscessus]|uniref:hypothetical protein n=1 Tax=Mycobacteroides abscessus TaxID=36809 RepID=UPI000C2694CD|nr:hypothetical protein [Mycobacteroides abscessus]
MTDALWIITGASAWVSAFLVNRAWRGRSLDPAAAKQANVALLMTMVLVVLWATAAVVNHAEVPVKSVLWWVLFIGGMAAYGWAAIVPKRLSYRRLIQFERDTQSRLELPDTFRGDSSAGQPTSGKPQDDL